MKLLHIFVDGPEELADRIVAAQSQEHEVDIIDLSQEEASYDTVVDAIFSCDRVILW